MSTAKREELHTAVERELRLMNSASVLHSQSIANHAGIHSTDIETLDILNVLGPMPAGRLGELTGLTSGAVTRLVDRLEQLGLARRVPDPADRRRVIVTPTLGRVAKRLMPLFMPLRADMEELLDGYSDKELELVLRFMRETTGLVRRHTSRLSDLKEH